MIKRENILEVNKTGILINSLIPLNTKNKEFSTLMELYDKARSEILEKLNIIKEYFKEFKQNNQIQQNLVSLQFSIIYRGRIKMFK